jgi:hypothetical protein
VLGSARIGALAQTTSHAPKMGATLRTFGFTGRSLPVSRFVPDVQPRSENLRLQSSAYRRVVSPFH